MGFAAERRNGTRFSPWRTRSVVATWTRCTASTASPRRTVTLTGSTRGSVDARTARGRGLAAPARRRRQAVSRRARRPGAHRHAEDVRPAARVARGGELSGRVPAREAASLPDRRRRARADGASDERGPAALPPAGGEGPEDGGVQAPLHRRGRARAHRGRSEETGGRLAAAPRRARGRARAPRPGGRRARCRRARRGPRLRLAPPALAAPRPAPDRRDRPRVGERDPVVGAAVSVRALDAADQRGDRTSRDRHPRGARTRPRAATCRRERREDLPRP